MRSTSASAGRALLRAVAVVTAMVTLNGCLSSASGGETVAVIPGVQPGGASSAAADVQGYPKPLVVTATLADSSATQMSITLSQDYAPAGEVSFLITNGGTMDHEMVVLKTDQPADSFPITGFEGEPNRFDEDAKARMLTLL